MADEQQQTQSVPAKKSTNSRFNLVVMGTIAIITLGFSAYLFKMGYGTAGGVFAGMVIGHFFGQAGATSAGESISSVAETLSKFMK